MSKSEPCLPKCVCFCGHIRAEHLNGMCHIEVRLGVWCGCRGPFACKVHAVPNAPKAEAPLKCRHDVSLDVQCASCISAISRAAEALLAPVSEPPIDLMHPSGRCTCGGEGRCEWCRTTGRELEIAQDLAVGEALRKAVFGLPIAEFFESFEIVRMAQETRAERDALKAQNAALKEQVDDKRSQLLLMAGDLNKSDAQNATLTAEVERLRDLIADICCNPTLCDPYCAVPYGEIHEEARAIRAAREAGKS